MPSKKNEALEELIYINVCMHAYVIHARFTLLLPQIWEILGLSLNESDFSKQHAVSPDDSQAKQNLRAQSAVMFLT